MTDVVSLNKQVFGTNVLKGGISRRTRRAMAEPLQVTAGFEMTYDDCECVDGGGIVAIYMQCSLGAIIASFGVGFVTGFLTSYLAMKIGKTLPTWVGKLIGFAVGGTLGTAISSQINKNTDIIKIPLFITWLPFVKFEYTYDLGDKAYDLISSIGGGFGGAAGGYAAGLATGGLVGAIA